ncbi:MAG: HAD-superfamily hydrolase, subfamily [Myxococcaceae bacterium]|nr:HAD-superfamily hydrolase, subfamily [Myxococcaceae bacterium]
MKHILSKSNRGLLAQFAWSNVLLGFDFDGTLAPIVSSPNEARLRPRTRRLLRGVAGLYPCVVISGRAQADVSRRMSGVGILEVIGNHGSEPWASTDKLLRDVARWQPLLEEQLAPFRGVKIENKQLSVAVHYRQSRQKKLVKRAIAHAASLLGKVRVIGGKQVVNILPEGAPHKGTALERARASHGCDTAIFVGDDETDEDVFTLDQPGQLVTMRVGAKGSSAATYCLRNQDEIDALLEELTRLRRRTGARA